jgi:hypothetical protein
MRTALNEYTFYGILGKLLDSPLTSNIDLRELIKSHIEYQNKKIANPELNLIATVSGADKIKYVDPQEVANIFGT